MPILRSSGRRQEGELYQGDIPTLQELGFEPPPPWPKARFVGSAIAGDLGIGPLHRVVYATRVTYTGGSGHKRLQGVCKDSAGSPLAGATCWAYRKDDDVANSRYRYQQEGTVGVSDAGGNYEVMVPTNDQYGIVSYKAGAPDVAGVTVNTLVGT